jgi:hypothetical protein
MITHNLLVDCSLQKKVESFGFVQMNSNSTKLNLTKLKSVDKTTSIIYLCIFTNPIKVI